VFSRRLPFVRCESGRRVGVAESGKMRKWENERISAAHGEGFSELRTQNGCESARARVRTTAGCLRG
jgi:hypothetical protein